MYRIFLLRAHLDPNILDCVHCSASQNNKKHICRIIRTTMVAISDAYTTINHKNNSLFKTNILRVVDCKLGAQIADFIPEMASTPQHAGQP